MIAEIEIALEVGRHFEDLGVRWLVGGSVASSIMGESRATADIDLVADLRGVHITRLCSALHDDYYVDIETARWAASTRRSFNLIQQATITKIDIFCCKDDPLSREQLERRWFLEVGGRQLPVCSAEDIIVQKLSWFEEGGRVSERQWRDALGVVRVRERDLDRTYLERHAEARGVAKLLAELLAEKTLPG